MVLNDKDEKMRKKNFKPILLLLVLFAGLQFFISSDEPKEDLREQLAPVNPKFLRYVNNQSKGLAPNSVDMSHLRGPVEESVNTEYPSYYDLRDINLVTAIKNQGQYYNCWTFAAYCSLESCLLPHETVDFSEWHLAVYHGFDYRLENDEAGNSAMTTAYLVRWTGPVSERDVPYGSPIAREIVYAPARHIQRVIILPEREGPLDNNTIKYFVTTFGPVDFAYMWIGSGVNNANASVYYPDNHGQNHRLAIVGWDDNYPASNFSYTPPGNGAFFVKNSWGAQAGDGGYYYFSYYDMSIQDMRCFNNAEPINNYGTIYQYDPLGQTLTWGKVNSWGANVFTAQNDEPIKAVGFYATDANMSYQIQIYKKIHHNPPIGDSLKLTQIGGVTYPGYYTVRLNKSVSMSPGEIFSVVINFINSKNRFSVPVEVPIVGHSSYASANPGESYISNDGIDWMDMVDVFADSNVCIKAYSEYKNKVTISLGVERKTVRAWIIKREYADLYIDVENLENSLVSKFRINRSRNNESALLIKEFSPDELENGSIIIQDQYIERDSIYTYQVLGLGPDNLIICSSNIIKI
jgi:C1A family cysteine protease